VVVSDEKLKKNYFLRKHSVVY